MLPGAGGRDGQWRRWEEAPSVLCPQLWRPKILHGVPTELLVSGVGSQDPTPRKHGSWWHLRAFQTTACVFLQPSYLIHCWAKGTLQTSVPSTSPHPHIPKVPRISFQIIAFYSRSTFGRNCLGTDGLEVLRLLIIKDMSLVAPSSIEKKLRSARTNSCMRNQILAKRIEFEASKKSTSSMKKKKTH